MPCRYIREDYLTSEHVDALDVNAERFYFRLFLVVDDFGRFDANEKILRSKCYPLKDDIRTTDITRWLTACEKAGLICLYTVAGKQYLEILRFAQTRANCRSSKSKYPDPLTLANNLQANANNLQALAAENENESETENETENESETENENENDISLPNGSEISAPAQKAKKSFCIDRFPVSVAEVLEISGRINAGMSSEQAQAYFDQRTVAEWHIGAGGTGRQLRPENIPADIRRWVDRDKADAARKANQANQNGGKNGPGSYGRYVAKN